MDAIVVDAEGPISESTGASVAALKRHDFVSDRQRPQVPVSVRDRRIRRNETRHRMRGGCRRSADVIGAQGAGA